MKAAVLTGAGEIVLEERDARRPVPGQVEVAVCDVAVCGSDQARFESRLRSGGPVVFGHEFSGRLSAFGAGVSGFEIGQAVTVAPLLNCGACRFCLAGHEYLCPERRMFGTQVDGALQERVCIPADRVFPLAEHVSLREGALVEPVAVSVHAVRQAGEVAGLDIAVLGAGAIGLLIAQVARAEGAGEVLVLDVQPKRLDMADELGFTAINSSLSDPVESVLAHTKGRGADVLFEATGSPAVGEYFMPLLAALGVIVVVGRIERPVLLNLETMLFKEARLVTSRYFSLADFQRAVELLAAGSVSVAPLIQKVMPFDRLGERQGAVVMDAARQVVRLLIEFDIRCRNELG